jgi:ketosteroid isomerase-like protein
MKRSIFTALLVVTCAPAALVAQQDPPAAAAPQQPSVQLPPALDRVLRDYERAWQARDAAALAALFAEDGYVLQRGRPPARGRAAVRAAYEGSGGPLSLRALSYAVGGDSVGYIIGGYSGRPGEPDIGKFVLALRMGADGRWLIAADIDNSNQPPRAAPVAVPAPR